MHTSLKIDQHPAPAHLPPQVVRAINALAKGKPDNTANADDGAFIIDSGQIRRGLPVPPRCCGVSGRLGSAAAKLAAARAWLLQR